MYRKRRIVQQPVPLIPRRDEYPFQSKKIGRPQFLHVLKSIMSTPRLIDGIRNALLLGLSVRSDYFAIGRPSGS